MRFYPTKFGEKRHQSVLGSALFLAGSFALPAASAQADNGVPRGESIKSIAGSCQIGPFEQTSKAGSYNQLCKEMTDAEKCLALLKRHFRGSELRESHGVSKDKLTYCLGSFAASLGIGNEGHL